MWQVAAHAARLAAPDDAPRQFDVRARELRSVGSASRTLQDADEVDDRVAPEIRRSSVASSCRSASTTSIVGSVIR